MAAIAPRERMVQNPGIGADLQTAEFVPRPTLGNLLAKDVFFYASISSTVMIWIVYFVISTLADDETVSSSDLSASEWFVIFLAMTAADVGILGWRIGRLSTFVNRGVETTAKIVGVSNKGDYIGLDYEYSYEGVTLKGVMGLGGFNPQKNAQRFIGRQISILVNPDNPKRTLILTKLK
jgi:hypothetical protein